MSTRNEAGNVVVGADPCVRLRMKCILLSSLILWMLNERVVNDIGTGRAWEPHLHDSFKSSHF